MSAASEWADRVRNLRTDVQQVISKVDSLSRHATANDLAKALSEPEVNLSNMPIADALLLIAVFGEFQAWLLEPAADGAPSRLNVLFKSS
jgi:hypothetical protein